MPPTKCKNLAASLNFQRDSAESVLRFLPAPGPANYTMRPLIGFKDHDSNSTKQRGPQWSIGKQHGTGVEFTSPGPAVYTLDKLTRNGSVGIVGGTMFRKTKDLRKLLAFLPADINVNRRLTLFPQNLI